MNNARICLYAWRAFDSYGFTDIQRRASSSSSIERNRRPFARRLSARNSTVIETNCGNEVTSFLLETNNFLAADDQNAENRLQPKCGTFDKLYFPRRGISTLLGSHSNS